MGPRRPFKGKPNAEPLGVSIVVDERRVQSADADLYGLLGAAEGFPSLTLTNHEGLSLYQTLLGAAVPFRRRQFLSVAVRLFRRRS